MGSTTLSDDDEFAQIVRLAPLVSLDLIIRDAKQNVLVALRTNEPAKGVYFVPGGRIRKDETIENAFTRILENETGCRASFADARFLGVFQHFHPTNRHGFSGYGTHYIVLAYEVRFDSRPSTRWQPAAIASNIYMGEIFPTNSLPLLAGCCQPSPRSALSKDQLHYWRDL